VDWNVHWCQVKWGSWRWSGRGESASTVTSRACEIAHTVALGQVIAAANYAIHAAIEEL